MAGLTAAGPADVKRYEPFIAAAAIMIVTFGGILLMPRIMAALSFGGPILGAAIAVLFMLAFFAVLWLRCRAQARRETR